MLLTIRRNGQADISRHNDPLRKSAPLCVHNSRFPLRLNLACATPDAISILASVSAPPRCFSSPSKPLSPPFLPFHLTLLVIWPANRPTDCRVRGEGGQIWSCSKPLCAGLSETQHVVNAGGEEKWPPVAVSNAVGLEGSGVSAVQPTCSITDVFYRSPAWTSASSCRSRWHCGMQMFSCLLDAVL